MAKQKPKYRRVAIDALNKRRRGKHHELVQGIFRELETLPQGSAVEIPLTDLGVGVASLRSAVHRVCFMQGVKIRTSANENNFFVWKK